MKQIMYFCYSMLGVTKLALFTEEYQFLKLSLYKGFVEAVPRRKLADMKYNRLKKLLYALIR